MGTSTEAILFYGYCWAGEDEQAIIDQHSAYWRDKDRIAEASLCLVDTHCSSLCPMAYVAVKATRTISRRGGPCEIISLAVDPSWDGLLAEFCETLGIRAEGLRAAWWLVSNWSWSSGGFRASAKPKVPGNQEDPLLRPVAYARSGDGRSVQVDLDAIIKGCEHVIADRGFYGFDGSPPMVALSADVVLAVAQFAQNLTIGISRGEQTAREFAATGPSVGGSGAVDAEGSTVNRIHVSAL